MPDLEFLVWGVPVYVSPWVVFLVAYLWWISLDQLKGRVFGQSKLGYLAASAVASILIFGSLVLHEVGHAVVGTILGQKVTTFGTFAIGAYTKFENKPFQMEPLTEVLLALVGPATNFFLWFLFVGLKVKAIPLIGKGTLAYSVVAWVAYANFFLGSINLLPLFFTDGAHALGGLVRLVVNDPAVAQGIVEFVSLWLIFFVILRWVVGRRGKKN